MLQHLAACVKIIFYSTCIYTRYYNNYSVIDTRVGTHVC